MLAWLRDGILVCFFIAADGTMSMQVTTPASQTIEITSKGTVLMFSSELHMRKEVMVEATGKTKFTYIYDFLIKYTWSRGLSQFHPRGMSRFGDNHISSNFLGASLMFCFTSRCKACKKSNYMSFRSFLANPSSTTQKLKEMKV